MNKFLSFISFVLFVNAVDLVIGDETDVYCWRDFKGVIPSDALPAGFGRKGKPIYIGQVIHESKLIAGAMYENDDKIYFELGETPLETNEPIRIKVFCADHPENLEWIATTIHDLNTLKTEYLIKGGYEKGFQSYIGRVHQGDQTYVGKVICRSHSCLALYINNHADPPEEVEFHSFEVLSYKPTGDDNSIKEYR